MQFTATQQASAQVASSRPALCPARAPRLLRCSRPWTTSSRHVHLAPASSHVEARLRGVARAGVATAGPSAANVKVDTSSHPDATVVTVLCSDRQQADLLEPKINDALKALNLSIRRATKLCQLQGESSKTMFLITEASTSEKVVKTARLEEIRRVVLHSVTTTEGAQVADTTSPNSRARSVLQTLIEATLAPSQGIANTGFAMADSLGLKVGITRMLKRYDFVSTGMGALCVTGWFWSHGQGPLEALSITAVSTIVALVMNELVFANKQ